MQLHFPLMKADTSVVTQVQYGTLYEHSHPKTSFRCFRSDVFLSAIGRDENGNNFIYSGTDLRSMLVAQLNDERTAFNYRTLYVKDVIVSSAQRRKHCSGNHSLQTTFVIIKAPFVSKYGHYFALDYFPLPMYP